MTPREREVARHALGLPNKDNVSYRNRFCAGAGHADFMQWLAMVSAGEAERSAPLESLGGDRMFWLTRKGAEAALAPGETLDREHFPLPSPPTDGGTS